LGVELYNFGTTNTKYKLIVQHVPGWGSFPVTVAEEDKIDAGKKKAVATFL
jgi:hypothetical protein